MDLREYKELTDELNSLTEEIAEMRGRYRELMKELKRVFGVRSLVDAKKRVRALKTQGTRLRGKYEDLARRFRQRWDGQIGAADD